MASKQRLWLALLFFLLLAAAGCTAPGGTTPDPPVQANNPPTATAKTENDQPLIDNLFHIAFTEQQRETAPDVPPSDVTQLARDNAHFALDLYQIARRQQGNIFFSPYSISTALAMTYAGARDETEQQMADALHFTLPHAQLHPAFNALDLALAERAEPSYTPMEGEQGPAFRLNIANSLWGQKDYPFQQDYLDLLAQHYGATLRLLDFSSSPDEARVIINDWVADATEQMIRDLLPQGAIDASTRLTLTNAIYFNAEWQHQFQATQTQAAPFYLLDGSEITAQMMEQQARLRYTSAADYQAIEMPYVNNVSMVLILPHEDQFADFETALDLERLNAILDGLAHSEVNLKLPKFDFTSPLINLKDALAELGMPIAFTGEADFSGIDGTRTLSIANAFHKAAVSIDEQGTEAAAATAIVMAESAAPEPSEPITMTVDRPFIFFIRDGQTGTILFMGRVLDPVG